jgi:hypothetical protein
MPTDRVRQQTERGEKGAIAHITKPPHRDQRTSLRNR